MEMSESLLAGNYLKESSSMYEELIEKERDLELAAELGRVLLDENEALKIENEKMLEHFKQKLHEAETERDLLKRRLESAESDYEQQMQELQGDVVRLRRELQRERQSARETGQAGEEAATRAQLENAGLQRQLVEAKRENKGLQGRVERLQESVCGDRVALREHAEHLEALRAQITGMRAAQRALEQEVARITAERDQLLQKVEAMETRHREEQQEIQRLQKTTEVIQQSLDCIQDKNRSFSRDISSHGGAAASESLSDELQQATVSTPNGTVRPRQLWWGCAWLPGGQQDELEDQIELEDDDSVLASMAANKITELEHLDMETMVVVGDSSSDSDEGSVPQFVRELRLEVALVYGQLRSICADLSFRHGGYVTANSQRGARVPETPEELAALEMDFKLGSLKETLLELRGLLMDLEVNQASSTSNENIRGIGLGLGSSVEKDALKEKMRQLDLLKREKELYDQKLMELEKSSAAIQIENGYVAGSNGNEVHEVSRQEGVELKAIKQDIEMKKTEIERKMTRTKSEMEVIVMTTSGYFAKRDESWGKWPNNNNADPMMDEDDIECD